MQVRAILASSALVAGLTAFAAPTPPPTVLQFRVQETNHQVVDLTAVGGPQQTTHLVTSSYVTLTTSDSARGKTIRVLIDSVHADSVAADGFDPSVFDSLRGTTASAWLSPEGILSPITADSLKGGAAKGVLRLLYPKFAPRVKVGDRWTDTTDFTGQGNGLLQNAAIKRITNWAVNNGPAPDGSAARKVEAAFSQSITGELQVGGGSIGYDGTGTGTATYFVAADGRQLNTMMTVSLSLSLTVPQAPEPIPVNGTVTTAVTPLR